MIAVTFVRIPDKSYRDHDTAAPAPHSFSNRSGRPGRPLGPDDVSRLPRRPLFANERVVYRLVRQLFIGHPRAAKIALRRPSRVLARGVLYTSHRRRCPIYSRPPGTDISLHVREAVRGGCRTALGGCAANRPLRTAPAPLLLCRQG